MPQHLRYMQGYGRLGFIRDIEVMVNEAIFSSGGILRFWKVGNSGPDPARERTVYVP
jgi:hypothetical protein